MCTNGKDYPKSCTLIQPKYEFHEKQNQTKIKCRTPKIRNHPALITTFVDQLKNKHERWVEIFKWFVFIRKMFAAAIFFFVEIVVVGVEVEQRSNRIFKKSSCENINQFYTIKTTREEKLCRKHWTKISILRPLQRFRWNWKSICFCLAVLDSYSFSSTYIHSFAGPRNRRNAACRIKVGQNTVA